MYKAIDIQYTNCRKLYLCDNYKFFGTHKSKNRLSQCDRCYDMNDKCVLCDLLKKVRNITNNYNYLHSNI